jgi:peptidyl-prolyl cis-trans isomerase B (cyclophilin B)
MVILETNFGDIKINLFEDKAPKTTANFKQYVEDGFYSNTIFHRVISNFMVQGGGMEPGMEEKTTRAPIENEADNGLSNKVGTLAMARTNDPHSATAQFFINVKDNNFLDFSAPNAQGYGYCVFAEVVDGMDVVEKMRTVKTGNSGYHQDVPVEDIIITSARIED